MARCRIAVRPIYSQGKPGRELRWRGKAGLIGGVTPDIDRQIANLKQQLEIEQRIVPDMKEVSEALAKVQ